MKCVMTSVASCVVFLPVFHWYIHGGCTTLGLQLCVHALITIGHVFINFWRCAPEMLETSTKTFGPPTLTGSKTEEGGERSYM